MSEHDEGRGTRTPASDTATNDTASVADLDIITAARKDAARWTSSTIPWRRFVVDLATPADHRECGGYVLGRFKNGYRDTEHLINRCAVTLDADKDTPPDLIDRGRDLGYTFAWHTTWRHTPEVPRYRLIFPTAERMDADQYHATAAWLMRRLGGPELFDKVSADPVQFMFRPSTQDRATYEHGSQDGALVPVAALETAAPERKTPLDIPALMERGIPVGEQDDTLARVAYALAARDADENEVRATWWKIVVASRQDGRPWSEADFDRHWRGAVEKVEKERTATFGTYIEPAGSRYVDGGTFIHDAPDRTPALWGRDSDVLWAQGESLMIAGGSGVGKTTLVGQLVRALIDGGDVLGYPVKPRRKVLYLAMDRPQQIRRALRRTLRWVDRAVLDERLAVWPGPPLADMAKDRELLLRMARDAHADTVVLDSLKDAAIGLSEDAVGAGYNSARQTALQDGVELIELHHLVKRGPNGEVPKTLADLYGSGWLTAGSGSVILLHGQAGDVTVKFLHLKQPEDVVGPFTVLHDPDAGTSSVLDQVDLSDRAVAAVVERAGAAGITAADAALVLFGPEVTAKDDQAVRRRLERLVKAGRIEKPVESDKRTQTSARYRGITPPITGGAAD